MIPTITALFTLLNEREIGYCHWKSNWVLDEALTGAGDLDVLIRRGDAPRFRSVLIELGFPPAIEANVHPFPSVEHYHSLDAETSVIVHVHAYYRVVSGDSLAKNHHLPFEEMLLSDVRRLGIVNVPSVPAETASFVVRMLLKHTSMIELAFVIRDWSNIKAEAAWLINTDDAHEAALEIGRWVPGFEPELLLAGADAISNDAPLLTRIRLGRRVRARLRSFERRSRMQARGVAITSFAQRALHKARGRTKGLTPGGGGAVIAFVGSEATGKSTMLSLTELWLRDQFTVRRIHAGKPPSTALTFLPNLVLPALRALAPRQRTTHMTVSVPPDVETVDPSEQASQPVPLLFAVRSLFLAHDRRELLRRAFADSANGMVVLSDRYPSSVVGSPDSPQLARFAATKSIGGVRGWLIGREAQICGDIPPADVVIQLCAPLDVTLERNRNRGKTEPEEFVRTRHALSSAMEFDHSRVHRIDTNEPAEATFALIRRAIWEAL